jgi:hypothetical protein
MRPVTRREICWNVQRPTGPTGEGRSSNSSASREKTATLKKSSKFLNGPFLPPVWTGLTNAAVAIDPERADYSSLRDYT